MIDFEVLALRALGDEVRAFVVDEIVPHEGDPRLTSHGPNDDSRTELVDRARGAGLLTIQAPCACGGRGLSHIEQAVVYEAAGWSTLGPVAMNCAAPDEGNVMLLAKSADETRARDFPCPGDRRPAAFGVRNDRAQRGRLRCGTAAYRSGLRRHRLQRRWVEVAHYRRPRRRDLDRHGARPAERARCGRADALPGARRRTRHRTRAGHEFDGPQLRRRQYRPLLRLAPSAVLGQVGDAFGYAQLRLIPARLTHRMRWLGVAERAQSIVLQHTRTRTAFGRPLAEHEGVSSMLANNDIARRQCRLAIWHTAWILDSGPKDCHESPIAKAFVSEELFKVADRWVRVLGGIGITDETVIEMIFRDICGFRLYDGPTEVHEYAIARTLLKPAEHPAS